MQFLPGDLLVRRVKGPINAHHYGVYLGEWNSHQEAVFHCTIGGGCHIVPFSQFAANRTVSVASRASLTPEFWLELQLRMHSLLGRMYRPLKMNCETAANFVHSGAAHSQTVQRLKKLVKSLLSFERLPFRHREIEWDAETQQAVLECQHRSGI